MMALAKHWKDFKCALKRDYYTALLDDEARLRNVLDRVEEDQWRALVAWWGTEEAKVRLFLIQQRPQLVLVLC